MEKQMAVRQKKYYYDLRASPTIHNPPPPILPAVSTLCEGDCILRATVVKLCAGEAPVPIAGRWLQAKAQAGPGTFSSGPSLGRGSAAHAGVGEGWEGSAAAAEGRWRRWTRAARPTKRVAGGRRLRR